MQCGDRSLGAHEGLLSRKCLKKPVVFHIGHLGDTVMILPSLWALRRTFPEARFTLMTDHVGESGFVHAAELFRDTDFFDDVISFEKNLRDRRHLSSMLRLLPQLRRQRFDAAVYLVPSLRTPRQIQRDRLYFRAAGIKHLIGFRDARADAPVGAPAHESLRIMRRLAADGIDASSVSFDLKIGRAERARLDEWLEAHGIDLAGKRCVAVAPFTKMPAKRWPTERYELLVAHIVRAYGVFPIIFGGADERSAGDALLARWAIGYNAAGLPVRETAALLQRCRAFVGADSGNMHLAAAVGVPCLAIFSARDEIGKWHPWGDQHIVLRKDIDCAGCLLTFCSHRSCLMQISVDEAIAAAEKLLDAAL